MMSREIELEHLEATLEEAIKDLLFLAELEGKDKHKKLRMQNLLIAANNINDFHAKEACDTLRRVANRVQEVSKPKKGSKCQE